VVQVKSTLFRARQAKKFYKKSHLVIIKPHNVERFCFKGLAKNLIAFNIIWLKDSVCKIVNSLQLRTTDFYVVFTIIHLFCMVAEIFNLVF
jgi:ABC-type multidrug transport system permease subunit